MRLFDIRTANGSRQFARLPRRLGRTAVRDTVGQLPRTFPELGDVKIIGFSDGATLGPWLHFTFAGHEFWAVDSQEHILLIVRDPLCPDTRLFQLGWHCEQHLLATPYLAPPTETPCPVLDTAH